MDKEASSSEKKRSLFWIVLIVLVMMMGALGWQAKSLLKQPEPAPAPATVWAKVPTAPSPTTIQIPQPAPTETIDSQNAEGAAPQTDRTDSQEIATAGQPDREENAAGVTPEKPAMETPETMVAAKQVAEEKASEATSIKKPTAKEKRGEMLDQAKAAPPAPENKTTADHQAAPTAAPAPPPATPEQVAAPEKDEKKQKPYTIQVGAFRVKTHAIDKLAQLAQKGYEPYLYETTGANRKPWYGVRFGHFETREQAKQALIDYKKKEKMDGIISRSDTL